MAEKVTPLPKLSPRRARFCEEYLRTLKPAKAYVAAGYSAKGAAQSAERLLNISGISAYIQALQDARAARIRVDLDDVVRELTLLAFSNALDYGEVTEDGDMIVNLADLTREQAAAIVEVTTEIYTEGQGPAAERVKRVKIKLADKKGALELLGRHFGGFPTKHEHAGVGGGPIQTLGVTVELTDTERRQRILQLMALGVERAASKGEGGQ